jgi:hypothetical protein
MGFTWSVYCGNTWLNSMYQMVEYAVKLCLYEPGQVPKAPGGWDSQNFQLFGTRKWQSCQPYASAAFTLEEVPLALISVRAIVRPKGLNQWKIPMTQSGFESTTFRFIAHCLTQLSHSLPRSTQYPFWILFYRQCCIPSVIIVGLGTWIRKTDFISIHTVMSPLDQ